MVLQECGVACTARHVARALSRFGAEVPWWRVVQSSGTVAEPVSARARERLAAEGVMVEGRRVPLDRLRWQPDPDVLREVLQRGGLL
jgi:alkylated DNA nucleotide flippase Atl1